MEPRVILIKPSYLPALPTYERAMRRVRIVVWSMPFHGIVIVAAQGYRRGSVVAAAVTALVVVPGLAYLMWAMTRRRARTLAEMAGERPILVAGEIDGGFGLRPSNARGRSIGLPVFPGDTVRVTVERSQDPRRGLMRPLSVMEWRFENGDSDPLVIATYFDADRALLRDVETRMRGLGTTVEITHTPFNEAT